MATGLNVSDVINVDVNIGPVAVPNRSFGLLLILGSSSVIDVVERIRFYSDLPSVAGDFGSQAPEYQAATIYFAQKPIPNRLAIGRYAATATAGVLHGGPLSAEQQMIANFQTITDGSLAITVDVGAAKALAGINLSGATSLSQIAAILQAALSVAQPAATVSWNGTRFDITSATTGAASAVSFGSSTGAGTDLSGLMGLTNQRSLLPVVGQIAETPLHAAQVLANTSSAWYGLIFATPLPNADNLLLAAFTEGSSPARMYGYTTNDVAEINAPNTTTLGYQLKALNYSKTAWDYSQTPNAIASLFARAFTVDFLGSNTTITLKFKTMVGVVPEMLTETQKTALEVVNGNMYVAYDNGAAIIQEGVMANGRFFDEVHGLDWLQNYLQNGQFNLLYTSTTKIPQTDPGITTLMTQMEKDLAVAVTNGLIAPGVWNADGFGQLKRGDTLTKGFYVYAAPVATQDQAERDARRAPLMQVAVKLAGAVHSEHVILNVNR